MSTTINVTVDDGGLPARNRQQTAANRQAFVQGQASQQAAQQGADQRAADRRAAGLDPATGRPLPSAGASSRLPRIDQEPAANRRGLESFTFAPSILDQTWITSDPIFYELLSTNLSTAITAAPQYAGSVTYSGTGGPGINTPKLRATALGWRSLGAENVKFTPKQSSRGITLEHWANFGPHGTPIYNETRSANVVSAISVSPIGLSDGFGSANVYPSTPSVRLYSEVVADPLAPETDGIYINCEVRSESTVRVASKRVISGLSASNDAGWNNFACEVLFDGTIYLYFNGQRLTLTEDDFIGPVVPVTFSQQLDSFLPVLIGLSHLYIGASGTGLDGTPRPWVDVHGVRYTKGLRYKGNSFIPLAMQ